MQVSMLGDSYQYSFAPMNGYHQDINKLIGKGYGYRIPMNVYQPLACSYTTDPIGLGYTEQEIVDYMDYYGVDRATAISRMDDAAKYSTEMEKHKDDPGFWDKLSQLYSTTIENVPGIIEAWKSADPANAGLYDEMGNARQSGVTLEQLKTMQKSQTTNLLIALGGVALIGAVAFMVMSGRKRRRR